MDSSGIDSRSVLSASQDCQNFTLLRKGDAFAFLRPLSPSARNAFNAAVDAITTNSSQDPNFEHYHRFVYAERVIPRASSVFTEDQDAAIVEEPDSDSASQQWNGAFKFSLGTPPHDESSGWYIGTSRGRSVSSNQGVDILLALPGAARAQNDIAGNHGPLYFHPETYRMVIQARHTVTVGKSGSIIRNSQSQVLDDKDLLMIGDHTYAFEYTSYFRSPEFEEELCQHLQRIQGDRCAMNKLLSPASVGAPIAVGEYFRSASAFAQGTFGQVSAGWARNGAAVAIKFYKDPKSNDIQSHKDIMHIIGNHDNVLRLLDCITHFNTKIPAAYCIYSPLAVMTLRDVISTQDTNSAAQIALLKDYLSGLSHLHGKGIMHRDIKSENLAVRSMTNPVGVILDLDAATTSPTSTDHMKGTVPYLAPEIIKLKDWEPQYGGSSPPPYKKSVDIWALGLSIFALLERSHWSWGYFSQTDPDRSNKYSEIKYRLFQNHLQGRHNNARAPGPQHDPMRAVHTRLILNMTISLPESRSEAPELLQLAQSTASRTSLDISIMPKRVGKHKADHQGGPQHVKRQNIE